MVGVLHEGGPADAEPDRPDELPGSMGPLDDLSEGRPHGLLESEECDLLCEISQPQDPRFEAEDHRVHHPVVGLRDSDGLLAVVAALDDGKCDRSVIEALSAAPADDPLAQVLRLRSLVCQGKRAEARALLTLLERSGAPGFGPEVRRVAARLRDKAEVADLPVSLSVDGRSYLRQSLSAATQRAHRGDVDGALAELDALDAQLRVASPRRRIARTRGEILLGAGRPDLAACAFYRAWTQHSGAARAEMSEKLDALAEQGVSGCQVELGERLESEHKALAATKASKRRAAVERLARRYRLSGRDRRALDALGRGHARADARDREGALGPYASAITQADHPEIAARARFDRATALRRLDRDAEAVEIYLHLVRKAPRSPVAPEALYQAGRLSGYLGKYQQARDHLATLVVSYPESDRIPDALWQAGWADWRRGDVPSAVKLFEHLGRYHGAERDLAGLPFETRALYWRARGLARLGRNAEAIDGYRYVMERFPLTYYAALAHHRIASLGVQPRDAVPFLPSLPAPVDPLALADLDAVQVPLHPRLRRGVALWQMGHHSEARDELHSQLKFRGVPRGAVEILSTLHAVDENYPAAHWVASRYGDFAVAPYEGNWRLWALAHPAPPELWKVALEAGQETGMDPALAMAIIRHESSYKTTAVSHRGAVGVMQLMPATARSVYRTWYGKEGPTRKGLRKPSSNIRSGLAMFALLDHVYSGNTPLMIAAYNAGPGVSARWWRDRGDLETDALVEEMTYPGTVAYLKKVLGSWYAYRVLYGDGAPPPIPLNVPDRLEDWGRPATDLVGALDTPLTTE